jgi:hypothetical protein
MNIHGIAGTGPSGTAMKPQILARTQIQRSIMVRQRRCKALSVRRCTNVAVLEQPTDIDAVDQLGSKEI